MTVVPSRSGARSGWPQLPLSYRSINTKWLYIFYPIIPMDLVIQVHVHANPHLPYSMSQKDNIIIATLLSSHSQHTLYWWRWQNIVTCAYLLHVNPWCTCGSQGLGLQGSILWNNERARERERERECSIKALQLLCVWRIRMSMSGVGEFYKPASLSVMVTVSDSHSLGQHSSFIYQRSFPPSCHQ